MKLVVYVLCYDRDSEKRALEEYRHHPWARVKFIPSTWYLESVMYLNGLVQEFEEWRDAAFVGTISWSASQKAKLPNIQEFAENLRNTGADVGALAGISTCMLNAAIKDHPHFLEVWTPLLGQMGYDKNRAESLDIPAFYCNYWLATPEWMVKYLTFFNQARWVLESFPDIQEALWSSANYPQTSMGVDRMRQIFGKPYYTYHPFICERLPCFFFYTEGAKLFVHYPEWYINVPSPNHTHAMFNFQGGHGLHGQRSARQTSPAETSQEEQTPKEASR